MRNTLEVSPEVASPETAAVKSRARSEISLRANFAWTFVGNVVYAGCQWAMLIVLAKLGSSTLVGEFALALAVTAPVFLFTNLNTRTLQASDARQEYSFGDYLALRLVTSTLGLAIVAGLVVWADYEPSLRVIVLIVGLAKAVESVSDCCFGLFQQHERMHIIALSMILKGILSLTVLVTILLLGHGLFAGVVGLALTWLAILLAYDVPCVAHTLREFHGERSWTWSGLRALGRLAWVALPLGFVLCLISLNTSIPRFFIEEQLGVATLGIFAALSYLTIPGTTVVQALGQSATPRLAQHLNQQDLAGFHRLLLRLCGLALVLAVAGVLVAWLAGRPLLTLLYRPEYADHTPLFLWLMLAAGLGYVSSLLGYALTAARFLRVQVGLFLVVALATFLACYLLVPPFGLLGAALALNVAAGVQLVGSLFLLWLGFFSRRRHA